MAEELAKDYSLYLNVPVKNEFSVIQYTIDEMLTRLDEFESLVSMIQTDGNLCVDKVLPEILGCRPHLDEFCNRIDRLEQLVDRVDFDLSHVEASVEQASHDLEGPSGGRLKTFLKPLFFKSAGENTAKKSSRRVPKCDISSIFATEDFFPPVNDADVSQSQ